MHAEPIRFLKDTKKSQEITVLMHKCCIDNILLFTNIPYILESNLHPNLIRTEFLAIS